MELTCGLVWKNYEHSSLRLDYIYDMFLLFIKTALHVASSKNFAKTVPFDA